jgi:flagellar basal-body rod protein FlgF
LGELVTASGDRVLDDAGGALVLPSNTQTVFVGADGAVSGAEGVIGRIDLVTFEDEQRLQRVGGGLYATDQDPEPAPATSRLIQGVLEGSNVQPVLEMTELMATTRAYQGTQRLLESHHDMQRRAVEQMLDLNQ